MEELKSNEKVHYNLEKSLSPLWKLTFYSGLSFDWYRRIPKQSQLSIVIRFLIRFTSIALQSYYILTSLFQMGRAIANPASKLLDLVLDLLYVWDKAIILFVCVYLLVYRTEIQAFFCDWGRMEEQYHVFKGVDVGRIKSLLFVPRLIGIKYYAGSTNLVFLFALSFFPFFIHSFFDEQSCSGCF